MASQTNPDAPSAAEFTPSQGVPLKAKSSPTALPRWQNSNTTSDGEEVPVPPLHCEFSFGICSDVQYADFPMGYSHGGSRRWYRDSLVSLRRAVSGWKHRGVDFGVHLGDIIDGKNKQGSKQGEKTKRSEAALSVVLDAFNELGKPHYHTIGNHCLYNFTREQLNQRLKIPGRDGGSYYSFSPHPDWLLIVIDTYDISMLGSSPGEQHHEQAKQILAENNPSEDKNDPSRMKGLQRRFVRFGGSVSQGQLQWLRAQLTAAAEAGQRVICFSHQPLHPDAVSGNSTTLCWNYDEVLEVLQGADNLVACFAGHTHQDSWTTDRGVHYRVLGAILETPPPHSCFGFVDVYDDHLDVLGVGTLATQRMDFRPSTQSPRPKKAYPLPVNRNLC
mmetsp:Transcript_19824/g.59886  ORF Transcript_19824/g.59886 Transcript_19824/m.59886 type:complete len:388 (-) Transcript_19824:329-1492(-)|eukprot:CAMPEP_0206137734 /NCGR_PEP_ID=MMETSP1473-20131121/2807_1 /ASSEMBLY_ACC=CAM_ASM_001109 /TAXON_ID=1461547 /ORGANISM="Stichococcus sp, Strain RCC1054" /LENGTH=387 /DNA_ID=CAMNT_0053530953 /DNA_START=441 /DNA_END=1604 /DNA_ORIENTATION=+